MPIKENMCSLNKEYENMIKEMRGKIEEAAKIYSELHESIRCSDVGSNVSASLMEVVTDIDNLCRWYNVSE